MLAPNSQILPKIEVPAQAPPHRESKAARASKASGQRIHGHKAISSFQCY